MSSGCDEARKASQALLAYIAHWPAVKEIARGITCVQNCSETIFLGCKKRADRWLYRQFIRYIDSSVCGRGISYLY